jgi:hypothetical protein
MVLAMMDDMRQIGQDLAMIGYKECRKLQITRHLRSDGKHNHDKLELARRIYQAHHFRHRLLRIARKADV